MPITPKPKRAAKAAAVDVDALIRRGGSVAPASAPAAPPPPRPALRPPPPAPVVLRLPHALLTRLDNALADRPLRTPRHTWLLEAVLEKLDREESTEF